MSLLRGPGHHRLRICPPRHGRRFTAISNQQIEQLEIRRLLSASLHEPTGVLTIFGTNRADHAVVDVESAARLRVTVNSQQSFYATASITKLIFVGKGGRDYFENRSNIPVYAIGGPGSDTLIGGSGDDSLIGRTGSDVLNGNAGNDTLSGQSGRLDRLDGGPDNDEISGGRGQDSLTGNDGDDTLYGGPGDDSLHGDSVTVDPDGASGRDSIMGGDGDDTLIGGGNEDWLDGGAGDDLVQSDVQQEIQTVHVTTLSPDGPGSLMDALARNNRHIVFDVGGVINLRSMSAERPNFEIQISGSNLTIDGSTAPSPGITIVGGRILLLNASNVTIKHIRVRSGDDDRGNPIRGQRDTMSIIASEDVLIQNVSLSWSEDEIADVWDHSRRITFDRVIFSEPLDSANHAHGLLVGNGSTEVTVRNSLFTSMRKRAPKFGFGTALDGGANGLVVNNIIYNPLSRAMIMGDRSQTAAIGNLVIPGPNTASHIALLEAQPGVGPGTEIYLSDNFFQDANRVMAANAGRTTPLFTRSASSNNPEAYDWNVSYKAGVGSIRGTTPAGVHDSQVSAPPLAWMAATLSSAPAMPVTQVYDSVLAQVGSTPWARDSHDARVVTGVIDRTGRVLETTNDIGGMPDYEYVAPSPESERITVLPESDSLFGGDGNDTITGGSGNDLLVGDSGDDIILGRGGDDDLSGGNGRDTLMGEAGADRLNGGGSVDHIDGGIANDITVWNSADDIDVSDGNLGRDEIQVLGTDGDDIIQLREVNGKLQITVNSETMLIDRFTSVTIDARSGNDLITTDDLNGFASDYPTYESSNFHFTIHGGDGHDTIQTAAANDSYIDFELHGGAGNDTLQLPASLTPLVGISVDTNSAFGDAGDDSIVGGNAAETLDGGSGNDTVSGNDGDDSLFGGDGIDLLNGGGDQDVLDGGAGDDRLLGGGSNDSLFGAAGNDELIGNSGNDFLDGSNGQDTLDAGDGNDLLLGGSDGDILVGGAGNDRFDGGDGADTIASGGGNDAFLSFSGDILDEAFASWFL
jgi:Ca2+-binding RTX toxin-like protein/pectate lyase